MERKIYVVGTQFRGYANWCEGEIVDKISDANLVLFAGGEDVGPHLYLANKVHPTTSTNPQRDIREEQVFQHCKTNGIKMLGICRGSQFLCAMAGGILVQNQDNPQYLHNIELSRGGKTLVTSSHHQAMYPWGLNPDDYKVIAWTKGLSEYHEDGDYSEMVIGHAPEEKECEIVWFKKNPSLNIQGHPEWMDFNEHAESIAYFRELLNQFMNDEEVG